MNRTTTVLAADVVGYSRHLAEDSVATIAALERLREQLIQPGVATRGATILRTSGDGYLIEFPSVASAIDFTFGLLSELPRHQAERPNLLTPDLRIGIHHGELNPDGQEPHGEAITISVRLQEIAQPGAVAISGVVHTLLGSKGNRMFTPLGERMLRHVSEPVEVWTWLPHARSSPSTVVKR